MQTVSVVSDAAFDAALAPLLRDLRLKETEETWHKIDAGLAQFQALTKGGAAKLPSYIPRVREIAPCITRSLLSERTRLSGTANDVLNSMAPRLGERFATVLPLFMPPLLQMCTRTNRVVLKRAERTLHLICKHCHLTKVVPYFLHALTDKAPSLRIVAAGCLVVLLESTSVVRLTNRVTDLEEAIRLVSTDANGEARAISKSLYALYAGIWPERVDSFAASLSPTAQRYLKHVVPREPPVVEDEALNDYVAPKRVSRMAPLGTSTISQPAARPSRPAVPPSTLSTASAPPPLTALRTVSRATARTSPASLGPQHASPRDERSSLDQGIPSFADPFTETGVPPLPRRGTNPSDAVAHRLALARESARQRTPGELSSFARSLSRSDLVHGGARRIVLPPSRATVSKGKTRAPFTPQRRPLSVVNDDRASPQGRSPVVRR